MMNDAPLVACLRLTRQFVKIKALNLCWKHLGLLWCRPSLWHDGKYME